VVGIHEEDGVNTSRLEQIKRRLADEYMETSPGVTRQTAKRMVEPRAKMMLTMVQINASAQAISRVMRRDLYPAMNRVARAMTVFSNTYVAHPPQRRLK
jgi:hypothetical protein